MTRAVGSSCVLLAAAAAAAAASTLDDISAQAADPLRARQHALPLAGGREVHGLPQAQHAVGGVALAAEEGSRVAAHACRGSMTCDV